MVGDIRSGVVGADGNIYCPPWSTCPAFSDVLACRDSDLEIKSVASHLLYWIYGKRPALSGHSNPPGVETRLPKQRQSKACAVQPAVRAATEAEDPIVLDALGLRY